MVERAGVGGAARRAARHATVARGLALIAPGLLRLGGRVRSGGEHAQQVSLTSLAPRAPLRPSPTPPGQLSQLWHTLLGAFERSLLHTHRSKFTQYLLFRACTEDPRRCCAGFVRALLSRLRDARQPPITRVAAAAYLASFLARCAPVPEPLVVDVLQQLATACSEYAGGGGGGNGVAGRPGGVVTLAASGSSGAVAGGAGAASAGGDAQRHQVFYAMVQALLYALCYHMEPLVHQQRQHPGASPAHAAAVKALVRERVAPLLGHPQLQPLAVCLPSVSAEFVRQAAALKLADLGPLLAAAAPGQAAAAAAQQRQPAAGDSSTAVAPQLRPAVRPLEMFFPFDPYLLRRSSRFLSLDTSYVRWRGGHPHAGAAAGGGAVDGLEGGSEDEGLQEDDEGASSSGGGSSSSSSSGSDLSSSDLEDEEDHHMAASLDGPAGLTPPGLAAAGAAAGRGGPGAAAAALMHRAASIGRLRPVGVAAAAAARTQGGSSARPSGLGLSGASGPSPDPMLLGVSIVSSGGLPDSYGAGPGALGPRGASPGGAAGRVAFHAGGLSPGSPGGGGTPLGVSPVPMSFTPYDSYMQSIPARLNTHA
jgi:RNA polymerase I-specific transcription initiation factor RRN3